MKIVSFKYDGTKKSKDKEEIIFATIEVETGLFFWKKKEPKKIYRKGYGWRFLDDGEYAYGVDAMWDAHQARKLLS